MGPDVRYRYCPYDGSPLETRPEEGRVLGACPRCGFVDYQNPKPCVAVLILRGNAVLLGRRAIEPARGMWDIPGGFIESGETAEDAVVREILEETSLHVRVRDFLGSIPDVYGERQEPTLNLCFTAEITGGEARPQSDVEKLAWFPLDGLPTAMAFDHQHRMLEWLKSKLRG